MASLCARTEEIRLRSNYCIAWKYQKGLAIDTCSLHSKSCWLISTLILWPKCMLHLRPVHTLTFLFFAVFEA